MMKSLSEFRTRDVRVLLTDIDGTLTSHGRMPPQSYNGLAQLSAAGLAVVPVTGRPAGWCELIARLWPVHGVVGENGALDFHYDGRKMRRHFARSRQERLQDRARLREIRRQVLREVPGCAVASDQFSRLFDLAIDFAEDVPILSKDKIQRIVAIFEEHGAVAKVSNIHVNGWFGNHNKISACKTYLRREFGFSESEMKKHCAFVGDSPNDEPMFEFLPHAFAVANIAEFMSELKHKPSYVASQPEAGGFVQVVERLLELR